MGKSLQFDNRWLNEPRWQFSYKKKSYQTCKKKYICFSEIDLKSMYFFLTDFI